MKNHDTLGYKLSACDLESNTWIDSEKTYSSYDEACKDAEKIRNAEHKAVHVLNLATTEDACHSECA